MTVEVLNLISGQSLAVTCGHCQKPELQLGAGWVLRTIYSQGVTLQMMRKWDVIGPKSHKPWEAVDIGPAFPITPECRGIEPPR